MRRPYRLFAALTPPSPHAELARRTAAAAGAVLAGGAVLTVLLHGLADRHAAPLARACTDSCRAVALAVTRFGEGWETLLPAGLVLIVCFVALWRRWPLEGRLARLGWVMAFVATAVGGSGLLAAALKLAIGRARPLIADGALWLHQPFAFSAKWASFPSGHATTAGATALVLALLFPRRARSIIVVAAIVAASRVIVGAHYPSDVAAGFALGAGLTLLSAAAFMARGVVFQLCGGRLWRLPVLTPPCAAAGLPRALKLRRAG